MRSQTLNISRYTNGTLVKIQSTGTRFVSYDYVPETQTGTFRPSSITLTPTFSGGVGFGAWQYLDGTEWKDIVNGEHGITMNGNVVTVSALSDLFTSGDAVLNIRCNGNDGAHWDTVTIAREVSPIELYNKSETHIEQTNNKIALIASEEELKKYSTGATLSAALSTLEQTSEGFRSEVTKNYATKVYTDEAADTAQSLSKNYTDSRYNVLDGYLDEVVDYVYDTETYLNTKITQTAEGLEVEISKKVGDDEIISKINASAEGVVIEASKIDLTGVVTATDLATAGSTVINGANITTGTITDDSTEPNMEILLSDGKIRTYDWEDFIMTEFSEGSIKTYDGGDALLGSVGLVESSLFEYSNLPMMALCGDEGSAGVGLAWRKKNATAYSPIMWYDAKRDVVKCYKDFLFYEDDAAGRHPYSGGGSFKSGGASQTTIYYNFARGICTRFGV